MPDSSPGRNTMSLVALLKAVHCRSTHHYFAIDALQRLRTPKSKQLGQMLLKYYEEYLDGAKAPDNRFRDFQNHVLHVQDNFWGGAIRESKEWAETAQKHLKGRRWKKAAFAIGVLSHYVTDPMMPLHTEQSADEGIVHRPLEWNVCKAYPALNARLDEATGSRSTQPDRPLASGSGQDWLTQVVADGATFANQYYHPMIKEHLALCKTGKSPVLNTNLEDMLLTIFDYTLFAWAGVLEHIADDCEADLPDFSLTLTTLLASIDVPFAWIVRRVGDATERRAVEKLLREYQTTGKVQDNQPRECRVVTQERLADRKGFRFGNPSLVKSKKAKVPEPVKPTEISVASPQRADSEQVFTEVISQRSARVNLDSPLVDAPSIGPRTASRFEKLAIHTIREFLKADVQEMQRQLDTSWIREQTLIDWQDQARLVCLVPALCGYKSQLLVGVGVRTRSQLAVSSESELHARIVALAETSEGKRILRSAKIPDTKEIQTWITSAARERAAA